MVSTIHPHTQDLVLILPHLIKVNIHQLEHLPAAPWVDHQGTLEPLQVPLILVPLDMVDHQEGPRVGPQDPMGSMDSLSMPRHHMDIQGLVDRLIMELLHLAVLLKLDLHLSTHQEDPEHQLDLQEQVKGQEPHLHSELK